MKNVIKCFHNIERDFAQSKSKNAEINKLEHDEIYAVIDWAMNRLTHFYLEKIEQWFPMGKIPWHEPMFFE